MCLTPADVSSVRNMDSERMPAKDTWSVFVVRKLAMKVFFVIISLIVSIVGGGGAYGVFQRL